jgi:hypothetical protein
MGFPNPMGGLWGNPQIAQMIGEITKPAIFEDRPEDWDRFDREWQKYESLIRSSGFFMPDAMRLEALRSRVGPASKLILQEIEDRNPSTEFALFYRALGRKYARDATGQARLAWHKVRLHPGQDGLITLSTFTKFTGEFKVFRNRVGDWTATEEYELLLRNLPPHWIQQLKVEENKRQRSRFWVKMTNAPDITAGELREALDACERQVKEIKTTDGGFLILAKNEENQLALETMSGQVIADRVVRMTRTQIRMTGDEILEWMDERLRVQDEARECIALHDRTGPAPRYYVQEITKVNFPTEVSNHAPTSTHTVAVAAPPTTHTPTPTTQEGGGTRPPPNGNDGKGKGTGKSNYSGNNWNSYGQQNWNTSWNNQPSPVPPPAPGWNTATWNAAWYADPKAVPYQTDWYPNKGKGNKGKGKGKGNGGQHWGGRGSAPNGNHENANENTQRPGPTDGSGEQRGRSRSRSRDSHVAIDSEPNPGKWRGQGQFSTACWRCQEKGRDFNHNDQNCPILNKKKGAGTTPTPGQNSV